MKIKLKAARVNSGLTLDDMARNLDISKSTICRWEKGQIQIPDEMLVKYCSICKMEPENIIL